MIRRIIIIFYSLSLFSCVTVTKSILPDRENLQISTNKKIYLQFVDDYRDKFKKQMIGSFEASGISSNNIKTNYSSPKLYISDDEIKRVQDFFPIVTPNDQHNDLTIEIIIRDYGYYDSYCILALAIVPCTPPFRFMVGARVFDSEGNFKKVYFIKESRVGIYWMPYFVPHFWNKDYPLGKEVMDRVVRNLLYQMHEDKLL